VVASAQLLAGPLALECIGERASCVDGLDLSKRAVHRCLRVSAHPTLEPPSSWLERGPRSASYVQLDEAEINYEDMLR
jgi:hypothetical protein